MRPKNNGLLLEKDSDSPAFGTGFACASKVGVMDVVNRQLKSQSTESFYVADLGEVVRQYQRWRRCLPRITPFYAIKCNTNPHVLKTLVGLGTGFDCASQQELLTMLEQGVAPENIIFANPCKQVSHLQYAKSMNVKRMTFDNAEELYKIKQHFPEAELLLRIITDDSRSVCKFSVKFGAQWHVCKDLLLLGKELGLNIVGVSFHVGSGCYDAMAFREAVEGARFVFDLAEEVGYQFSLLDVGGGFPGNHSVDITFEAIAKVLNDAVTEMFPPHIEVIAEPGRFFVASAFTLAVNIYARRTCIPDDDDEKRSYMYYVNDGVYGSFNCVLFDHAVVNPLVLMTKGKFVPGGPEVIAETYKSSIWGPTCDSMDCITKDSALPLLEVGDWMYFENMGAYTLAAASTFNGFQKSRVLYTNTEETQ